MEQAAKAPFDEKLSIISLILAKLDVSLRLMRRKRIIWKCCLGS